MLPFNRATTHPHEDTCPPGDAFVKCRPGPFDSIANVTPRDKPSDQFSELARRGLEIPSFSILWIRVVRGSPSLLAAPLGPPITQPTCSRVWRIAARSVSISVPL